MPRFAAIAASALVVVLLAVGTLYALLPRGDEDVFAQCREAQVAGGSIGGPFELQDKTGATVTDADVITGPSLVYFGYTFCPDVCPLDNARNAEAVEILESRGQMVQPVFISIDPDRDTPEILRDFTDNLHERMLGLTGSPEQVAAASKAYRTYYKKHDPEPGNEEFYLVDHSTWSYLVFPGEGLVGLFKRDETPQTMADRIGCFLDAR